MESIVVLKTTAPQHHGKCHNFYSLYTHVTLTWETVSAFSARVRFQPRCHVTSLPLFHHHPPRRHRLPPCIPPALLDRPPPTPLTTATHRNPGIQPSAPQQTDPQTRGDNDDDDANDGNDDSYGQYDDVEDRAKDKRGGKGAKTPGKTGAQRIREDAAAVDPSEDDQTYTERVLDASGIDVAPPPRHSGRTSNAQPAAMPATSSGRRRREEDDDSEDEDASDNDDEHAQPKWRWRRGQGCGKAPRARSTRDNEEAQSEHAHDVDRRPGRCHVTPQAGGDNDAPTGPTGHAGGATSPHSQAETTPPREGARHNDDPQGGTPSLRNQVAMKTMAPPVDAHPTNEPRSPSSAKWGRGMTPAQRYRQRE
ncbi:hypothetical protein CPB84DRAFT_1854216 [Gymnopilus junonius]|uniref:Uncharacterized protein n=1 Tax=Gymnopilus junonius TaxID=109634 RepID=A0A9P5TFZ1_GYMJU|nr:hypothetical protein CPB84DRAFT_1854216 [Gymnopilus junonius]